MGGMASIDQLATCPDCGILRVVTIEMHVGIDGLECRSCLACGRTWWQRAGLPASWEDVQRAARALWATPIPRGHGRRLVAAGEGSWPAHGGLP
jgi:hypothetical protein